MDEKVARLWIKLEWKALRKALNSEGEERQLAIRDALSSKDPTGSFIKSMPTMKTGLKHMKDLQHLLILCSAQIHRRSTKQAF